MSGHSKWHSIKHKKAKEDAKRGAVFSKLIRAITIAAKMGGGDPSGNPTLAAAIEKAKSYNMPQDNIEKAIKRGIGGIEGQKFEEVIYEGYGPEGVAIMVQVMTDNRNRASSEIRNIFNRRGANMGEAGCVNWMFEKKGLILVSKEADVAEDDLINIALEAGADDVSEAEDNWEIITDIQNFEKVRKSLEENNIKYESAEITMIPKNIVRMGDKQGAKKVLQLIDAFEESAEVQEVYANFDIPAKILEELALET